MRLRCAVNVLALGLWSCALVGRRMRRIIRSIERVDREPGHGRVYQPGVDAVHRPGAGDVHCDVAGVASCVEPYEHRGRA